MVNLLMKHTKKELGKACTYLSFSTNEKYFDQEKGEYSVAKNAIKAIMKNDLGGRDVIIIPLNKSFDSLTPDDFRELFYGLNSRHYGRGTSTV